MSAMSLVNRTVEWFMPDARERSLSDRRLESSFIFLHLFGPLMAQTIGITMYFVDPVPGYQVLIIEASICAFWLLPFYLRKSGNLRAAAYVSVQLLTFVSLFGAFFYGGMSSPFLPWLLVALLLGFFYLAGAEKLLFISLGTQLALFSGAGLLMGGFPTRVPLSALTEINLISALAATVYMSWMAIFYAEVVADRSEVQKEAERRRETTLRLRETTALAEQANRNKSIFLAKMSHELRTPLNAVIGYSEILLEDADTDNADSQKLADLQRINAAGRHLLALVADVLDLSRIEADMIELDLKSFELDGFIEDIEANTKPLVEAHGNTLEIIKPAGEVTLVNDPLKLRQVVLNLLSNAGKFTKDGTVSLVVRNDTASGWLDIEVRDTGIGITESELPHLFQEFHQASTATAKNFGGTGLGLVLTQRFVTLMGGDIDVHSEMGKGSVFTVRIPAAVEAVTNKDLAA